MVESVMKLHIYVQPRASRNEIVGMHGDALKVRLAAPPVDGAANEALVEFLAKVLRRPKTAIRIVSGATGRRKVVEIEGSTEEEIVSLLNPGSTSSSQ